MPFVLVDSLTLPGDPAKPNDDALAFESACAVIMDGATGLGEPLLAEKSDAAWVAQFGCERLMAGVRAGTPCDEALRVALEETEAAFLKSHRRAPKETYEIPFASMMFVSVAQGRMSAMWFGDCAALMRRPAEGVEVVGDAIVKRARESERVAKLAQSLDTPSAQAGVREIFLPALRRARNLVNTEKGGWLFGPDARAASHVARTYLDVSAGTLVLLVTDGFLALASDYDCYNPDQLLDAVQSKGLASLGKELRAIEETDPDGKRFPRFKKSDDATALLLRVT